MKLEKNTVLTGELTGPEGMQPAPFKAEISPCSWMYPGYGLQFRVELESGDWTMVTNKAILFDDAEESHAMALIQELKVCPCKKCSQPAFDPSTCLSNRGGVCERCFLKQLRAECEAEQAKEEQKLKRKDARLKKQGFTHRIDAWIHPASGGDDYQVSIWMVNPTEKDIHKELRKLESCEVNDFKKIEL
ncbi:hypothetical protein [Pseudomonas sp. GOM6]|uniref:hypothetical protein n=1 Tax=Pseudomonas sp. GOM6 TaxID=3036944 RepID=UPI0024097916|nr:hypothetical protein [Pseudomonas sp. GOM6]MDG1581083.1 hypothetical protein [Pseudomonas sp. GOM6]